ncbi:hypothetical protein BGW36DRAFT_431147 [Talaromyces proteolyticus]|uniref:Uncharacterized protein n=1 Tax=Talaromyces proteolyticus TaxID=1131652 RepID=A0AAD4KHI2_9EURO|nr:uncharacterized protein BGW36DRAFT_431147 [Talaromyces proteolyticus]KAH8691905.1 hypothetical protein BGW36DRAFT_431147 [Talaromyces proteolyticus]
MAFLENPLKTRLLTYWATLVVFIIAGVVSIVLALVVLLDPNLKGSGIVTLQVGIAAPSPELRLFKDSPLGLGIPPPIETIAAGAPTALGSVVTGVQSAVGSEASAAQSAIQSAAAAVDSIELGNISIGTENLCLGFKNGRVDCRGLPLNISSILPETLSSVLGESLETLQTIENTLVSAILGTVRRSLIAGVVLVISCAILSFFHRSTQRPWQRVTIILVSIVCLITPFVISTATVHVVLSKFERSIRDHLSQFFTTQNGRVGTYCTAALVCATVMTVASIGLILM